MNRMFGAYRNLHDTTVESYHNYLARQYRDKATCCGITPAMFSPYFQTIINKMLGIYSYEEWKAKWDEHNAFIISCRLAPDAEVVLSPPSPQTPVARSAVPPPWEIL